MASSNLELVRAIYAAWERGDFSSADWAHPEIEYVAADGPAPGAWRGLAAMAGVVREQLSAWEDFRLEAEEYRELDGERVLVLVRRRGRGKTSGVEVHSKGAQLLHLHAGKVTRFVSYADRERALADVGLATQDDSARA